MLKLGLSNKILKLPAFSLSKNNKLGIEFRPLPVGNLSNRNYIFQFEKEREFRVLLLTFLLGFLTSAITNFDIFAILKSKGNKGNGNTQDDFYSSFGWENFNISDQWTSEYALLYIIIGFLGGYFIFLIIKLLFSKTKIERPNLKSDKIYSGSLISNVFLGLIVIPIVIFTSEGSNNCLGKILIGYSVFYLFFSFSVIIHNYSNNHNAGSLIALIISLLVFAISIDNISHYLVYRDTGLPELLFTKRLFSFMFAGAFLSMGSKFWHDILDLVFQVKNLKQKARDPFTYSLNSASQIEEFVNIPNHEIVKAVYDEHADELLSIEGVKEVSIDLIDSYSGKYGLIVGTTSGINSNIESPLLYKLHSGRLYPVQVRTIEIPEIEFSYDAIISNTDIIQINRKYLTLASRLFSNGKEYILTCAHGFLSETERIKSNRANSSQIQYLKDRTFHVKDEKNERFVEFKTQSVKYIFNKSIDAAIIEIPSNFAFMKEKIGDSHYESSVSNFSSRQVFLERFANDGIKVEGRLVAKENNVAINVKDGNKTLRFNGVFKVSCTKQFSRKGDSGSLVIDAENKIVGIAFASRLKSVDDLYYSYLIPITVILDKFNSKLNQES